MRKTIKYFILLFILLVSCQTNSNDSNYRIVEVVDSVPIIEYKWKSGKRILREQSGKDTIGWKEVKTYYRIYDN